jgi:nucleotide sugar dehydrogenase
MIVALVGLGKIGLPLAAHYAARGHTVIGCDVNPRVVDDVNAGRSPVVEEPGLELAVASGVAQGRLRATLDTRAAVGEADIVIVIVPLVVDEAGQLNFASLEAATGSIASGLHTGCTVIYETTLPVGSTRGRLAPLLEGGSGLRAGTEFGLAFSPERVYSGRIFEDLARYPKIVGGIDAASICAAASFYRSVLDAEVVEVTNLETAEFAKLAETTYRDVNFALANQLALYARRHDVNAREAFRVANTQPFSHLHPPNIGIGGHCIPVYPHFLLYDRIDGELELLRIARQTNDGMAAVAVQLLGDELGGLAGQRVLVLGMAYRENVKELSFSIGPRLAQLLSHAGAEVLLHDALFGPSELQHIPGRWVEPGTALEVEAVVIQAPHDQYQELDWRNLHGLRVVLDGRGQLDPDRLAGTGAVYLGVDGLRLPPAGV